jgi:hypothetical protein
MRHTSVVDSGAGSDVASARQGLACATQAGLTRPGLSIAGGSLAPPAASVGGTARQVARLRHPSPSTDVGGLRSSHSIGCMHISETVGGLGGGAALAPPHVH